MQLAKKYVYYVLDNAFNKKKLKKCFFFTLDRGQIEQCLT